MNIISFIKESNAIEGIDRDPTPDELIVTEALLLSDVVRVTDLIALAETYQPGARLRDRPGLDVSVGGYRPPAGGPLITESLTDLLSTMSNRNPWANHIKYELLHPFTDGNGRTGRTLWAWDMGKRGNLISLPFLHHFYYQTLFNINLGDATPKEAL